MIPISHKGVDDMSSYAKLYWVHALTPLHVGAGQGLDFVDLPIMREKATGWPLVPGSGVKGAWRSRIAASEHSDLEDMIFGVAGENEGHAGAVVIGDANVAFLPVRSLYGTFAYVTTPLVLRRIQRDSAFAAPEKISIPALQLKDQALTTQESVLLRQGKVFLEDLDFDAQSTDEISRLATQLSEWIFPKDPGWQRLFQERLLVVPDNMFNYLAQYATEVVTRVRIEEETKTVASGALWNEENLPAETILLGVLWCDRIPGNRNGKPTPKELLQKVFHGEWSTQMGGNQTIGMGRVRCVFGEGREVSL
jgi:CRISPR-associated protein Cmr4